MKYLFIFSLFLLLPLSSISQEARTITIDKGTNMIIRAPFYGLYDYSQFGMIYTRDEILGAGFAAGLDIEAGGDSIEIKSLFFEYSDWTTGYTAINQTVKFSHTSATYLERGPTGSGSSYVDPDYRDINLRNTTTVKENFTFTNPSNEGWEEIGDNTVGQATGFDTPFYWNGVDNILISWENRDGTYTFDDYGWLRGGNNNSGHSRRAHSWRSDNFYPTASSSYNSSAPNIKLVIVAPLFNPLPITLGTFSGIIAAGTENTIQLDWTTQSEKDNNYFTLWRSYDGQTWEDITQLSGAGNSNEVLSYQYMDRNIISQLIENNSVYYKLSQTDYDGTIEFFHVIPVEVKSSKIHIVSRTNYMGQEVDQNHKGLIIETWNNGTVVKSFQ
jgi:hypothetical protein